MDILDLSLLAAVAIVALGVLTPNQARNAVDLNVIVLIAASFGLGAALQQSGLAESLASGLISVFDPFRRPRPVARRAAGDDHPDRDDH
jgi:di/tricarboxylate transporter